MSYLCNSIKVNINSLGDAESRNNYREALINHFKPHIDELCEDCRERLVIGGYCFPLKNGSAAKGG